MATVSYSDYPHQHGDYVYGAGTSEGYGLYTVRGDGSWMTLSEPIKPLQRTNCLNCGARWHEAMCDYCGTIN